MSSLVAAATTATTATTLPVAQLTKRAALSQSQTLRGALSRSAAPNTSQGAPQGHLAAPLMKRKPLGELVAPGTISGSGSSSAPLVLLSMNQSLNSSFLQTFSNMNTADRLVFCLVPIIVPLYPWYLQTDQPENREGEPALWPVSSHLKQSAACDHSCVQRCHLSPPPDPCHLRALLQPPKARYHHGVPPRAPAALRPPHRHGLHHDTSNVSRVQPPDVPVPPQL